MMIDRRKFLKAGSLVLAPGLLPAASLGAAPAHKNAGQDDQLKEALSTPVVHEADVIVCGGGPAGIGAAISAARQGAKTVLIEMYGCLGGVWTSSLLSNILDFDNKAGVMKEIVRRLSESDAQYKPKCYDAEFMKLLLDQMCWEAGVEVRLYTRVTAAYTNKDNKLEHVVTESFSGREAWKAKVFIDTTGNGELGARAGCEFEVGHPDSGKTQPMTLMVIIGGLDEEEVVAAGFMEARAKTSEHTKKNLREEIIKAGHTPSFAMPTLFAIRPGMIAMMTNHQHGVSAMDAGQITRATIEARAEIHDIVNKLRKRGGVWSDMRVTKTGSQIGIREGRRIRGHYLLTVDDVTRGATFDDAVCKATFHVDVHSLQKYGMKGKSAYSAHGYKVKPYDIPLRSLIARDVDGLMMAGRCISGDFYAHASYRVTGNAVAMGQAAGKVAALAAGTNRLPHQVDWKEANQE